MTIRYGLLFDTLEYLIISGNSFCICFLNPEVGKNWGTLNRLGILAGLRWGKYQWDFGLIFVVIAQYSYYCVFYFYLCVHLKHFTSHNFQRIWLEVLSEFSLCLCNRIQNYWIIQFPLWFLWKIHYIFPAKFYCTMYWSEKEIRI